jgi:2-C-methyl-D-erythritol 2,4-cyclodiphosphate synthase
MIMYDFVHAIGQDSHRFVQVDGNGQPLDSTDNHLLILGGCVIPGGCPLQANSDGDVLLHALTNAVSGITCVNILGDAADKLCLENGVKDSRKYLELALGSLVDGKITHVSFSIECKTPRLAEHIGNIRQSIASLLQISSDAVGITATSGEGLSAFGKGEGIMVFCSVTVRRIFGDSSEVPPKEDLRVL